MTGAGATSDTTPQAPEARCKAQNEWARSKGRPERYAVELGELRMIRGSEEWTREQAQRWDEANP